MGFGVFPMLKGVNSHRIISNPTLGDDPILSPLESSSHEMMIFGGSNHFSIVFKVPWNHSQKVMGSLGIYVHVYINIYYIYYIYCSYGLKPPTTSSCRSQVEQQLYLEVKIENLEAEVKLLMKAVESKQKQASRRGPLDAVDGGIFVEASE